MVPPTLFFFGVPAQRGPWPPHFF